MNDDLLKGADSEEIRAWRKKIAEIYPFLESQLQSDKQFEENK